MSVDETVLRIVKDLIDRDPSLVDEIRAGTFKVQCPPYTVSFDEHDELHVTPVAPASN